MAIPAFSITPYSRAFQSRSHDLQREMGYDTQNDHRKWPWLGSPFLMVTAVNQEGSWALASAQELYVCSAWKGING